MNSLCSNISVVVLALNWNGEELLKEYLPHWIENTKGDNIELIVIDNGSTDSSRDLLSTQYPEVKTIFFDKNYGFAEGYNKAISIIDADIVVLLNSDAEPINGWLDEPIRILSKDKSIAAIQPKILSRRNPLYFEYAGAAGGFIDKYGYPYCRGRIFDSIEKDLGQYNDNIDIFWSSGAALIIRREDYINIGGLDTNFFAHQEEIDMCWRLKSRGRRIVYCANSTVLHYGGASLSMNNPYKTYLNFRNNLIMIYKNIPKKELNKVMMVRFFLDYISAFMFLIKGNVKSFLAVLKARIDYRKMKKQFAAKRFENIQKSVISNIPEQSKSSIVYQYFTRGRHKYSDLPDNLG